MSGIVQGITNLFRSIFEIIGGIFSAALGLLQGALKTVWGLFEGVLNAAIGLVKGTFNLAEGVVGFIIGNLFIIGTVCAVYFGYILYQERQGKRPAPISKVLTGKNN